MFDEEEYTFEAILERMLDTVPDTMDKREGSIIYDALAPAAAELAQNYIWLQNAINLVFVDTSVGQYLDRLCNQIGITRKPATAAIKQGNFYDEENNLMDVEIGSRFTCGDLYWSVIAKISDGVCQVQSESTGVGGNNVTGDLIPVDYIDKLGTATLTNLLIPGEDEEDDDTLRARYLAVSNDVAFAGNIEDYKEETKALDGVGGVKVIPVWNGGGTVKLIIINSDYNVASKVLLESVQTAICPNLTDEGTGLAPIGHKVTIVTPSETQINVSTKITLSSGSVLETVRQRIKAAIDNYLLSLRKTWEESNSLVIRISQIESTILNVEGVLDVSTTTINGQASNLEITQEYLPVLGTVEVHEQ